LHAADPEEDFTMIIWRGLGFLVVLVTGACVFAGSLLANKLGGEGLWNNAAWPAAASLFAAGALCWLLGRRLNKPASKEAGDHRRAWTHDLFFVRMEWWAFPLAAVAVAAVVLNFTPGRTLQSAKAAGEQVKSVTK
jgi:hypothetical protein